MSTPATQLQLPTPPSPQQVFQMQRVKFTNGLQAGLKLLESEVVVAPIKLHEGLTDLKWLIQSLLSGQFTINFDLQSLAGPPQPSQPDQPSVDADKDTSEANGEDTK